MIALVERPLLFLFGRYKHCLNRIAPKERRLVSCDDYPGTRAMMQKLEHTEQRPEVIKVVVAIGDVTKNVIHSVKQSIAGTSYLVDDLGDDKTFR